MGRNRTCANDASAHQLSADCLFEPKGQGSHVELVLFGHKLQKTEFLPVLSDDWTILRHFGRINTYSFFNEGLRL
jgi:hypothetical protein